MSLKRFSMFFLIVFVMTLTSCSSVNLNKGNSWKKDTFPKRTLWWVDKTGNETMLQVPPDYYYNLSISPDGTKIAASVYTGIMEGKKPINTGRNIVIIDLQNGTAKYSTDNVRKREYNPVWSPDGDKITYYSMKKRRVDKNSNRCINEILLKNISGVEHSEVLGEKRGSETFSPSCWNGKLGIILVNEIAGVMKGNLKGQYNIGMFILGDKPEYRLLFNQGYDETQAQLSPDGKWLAYCTNESGIVQVYVSPFPDVNQGKWQISTDGGNSPRWSPDGKELYYLKGGYSIESAMAVKIKTIPEFSAGRPEVLFKGNMYINPANPYMDDPAAPYDIHPDGQRFIMIKPDTKGLTPAPEYILPEYIGIYKIDNDTNITVSKAGYNLGARLTGKSMITLTSDSATTFFDQNNSRTRVAFYRDNSGIVTHLVLNQSGIERKAVRINDMVHDKNPIELPAEILLQYIGIYQLDPQRVINITMEGDSLFAQTTNLTKKAIFPESESKFFYRTVDAQLVFFKNGKGKITHLVLTQGNSDFKCPKK